MNHLSVVTLDIPPLEEGLAWLGERVQALPDDEFYRLATAYCPLPRWLEAAS